MHFFQIWSIYINTSSIEEYVFYASSIEVYVWPFSLSGPSDIHRLLELWLININESENLEGDKTFSS